MMHAGRSADKQIKIFEHSSKLKNRRTAAVFLLLGILAAGGLLTSPVYASGEKAAFGSESYEWNLGETSAVGIYGTSEDTEITAVTCTVSYDAQMLTYGWGGELTEDGLVTLSGNNSGDAEYRDYIYFVPAMAGETTLTIESMSITESDGSVVETEAAEVTVYVPIPESCRLTALSINGEEVDGFDPATASYTLSVDADIEEATVIASAGSAAVEISDTTLAEGENTIYVTVTGTDGSIARYTLYVERAEAAEEDAAAADIGDEASDTEDTASDEAASDGEDTGVSDADASETSGALNGIASAVSSFGMLFVIVVVVVIIVVIVIIVLAARRGRKSRHGDAVRELYLEADRRAEEAIRNHTIRRFDEDDL